MPSTRCPADIDLDRPPRGCMPRHKGRRSHQFDWSIQVCGYDVDILVRAKYAVLPGSPATDIDPPEYPMVEDATFEVSFDGGRHWISPGDALTDALAEDERVRGILLDGAGR